MKKAFPLMVHLYKLLDLFGDTMSKTFSRQWPTLFQRIDRFDLVMIRC